MSLPSPSAQEKLWKTYFLLVHPTFPILDRDEILRTIHLNDKGPKISLLLFYCIMSTAQLFLDAREGHDLCISRTNAMFDKAQLLYDLQWEDDPSTLLEAALLMTYSRQSLDEFKNSSYWLTQAVSLAYKLNFHRNPATLRISDRQKCLRKQLWWSLYIRERMLSLDSEGPWKINHKDHDVPLLEVADFVSIPLLPSLGNSALLSSPHYLTQQRQLALFFIEKLKVTLVLGQLAPIRMSDGQCIQGNSENRRPQLSLQTLDMNTLDLLDAELKSQATDISIRIPSAQEDTSPSGQESMFPMDTFHFKNDDLLALHHGALILLHRIVYHHAASIRCLKNEKSKLELPEDHLRNLSMATRSIAYYINELSKQQLATFIQMNGLSVMRPIILWKILTGDQPDWVHPCLGPEFMRSLNEKVNGHDIWAPRAAKYAKAQANPSHFEPSESDSSQLPQAANLFDSFFKNLDSDHEASFSHDFPHLEICSF